MSIEPASFSPNNLDSLMNLATEVVKEAENKDLTEFVIRSFEENSSCIVDTKKTNWFFRVIEFVSSFFSKKKVTAYSVKDNLTYLNEILNNSSVPAEKNLDQEKIWVQTLTEFSKDIHAIIGKGERFTTLIGKIDAQLNKICEDLNADITRKEEEERLAQEHEAKIATYKEAVANKVEEFKKHPEPLSAFDEFIEQQWNTRFPDEGIDEETVEALENNKRELENAYQSHFLNNISSYADKLLKEPPKHEDYKQTVETFDAYVNAEWNHLFNNQPIPDEVQEAVLEKKRAFDKPFRDDFKAEVTKNAVQIATLISLVTPVLAPPAPSSNEGELKRRLEELTTMSKELTELREASSILLTLLINDPLFTKDEREEIRSILAKANSDCDKYIDNILKTMTAINVALQPKPQPAAPPAPGPTTTVTQTGAQNQHAVTIINNNYYGTFSNVPTQAGNVISAFAKYAIHPSNQLVTLTVVNSIATFLFNGGSFAGMVSDLGLMVATPIVTHFVVKPITDKIVDKFLGETIITPLVKPIIANVSGILLMRYGVPYTYNAMAYTVKTIYPPRPLAATEEPVCLPTEEPSLQTTTTPVIEPQPVEGEGALFIDTRSAAPGISTNPNLTPPSPVAHPTQVEPSAMQINLQPTSPLRPPTIIEPFSNLTTPAAEAQQSPITGMPEPQAAPTAIPTVLTPQTETPQEAPSPWIPQSWKDTTWKVVESAKRGLSRPVNVPLPYGTQALNAAQQAVAGQVDQVPPIQGNANPIQGVN